MLKDAKMLEKLWCVVKYVEDSIARSRPRMFRGCAGMAIVSPVYAT